MIEHGLEDVRERNTQLKALLLDADGVIQRAPADLFEGVARMLGVPEAERERCIEEIFAAETAAMTGAADFSETIAPFLSRWSASEEVFREAWHRIEAAAAIPELIAELRQRGIYCALASNQERHRARHMSETMGYCHVFDREFYSCELGHAKPSVAYFRSIIALAELDPKRTLFLDDRPANVAAAREAGLVAETFVLDDLDNGAEQLRRVLGRHGFLA